MQGFVSNSLFDNDIGQLAGRYGDIFFRHYRYYV